MAASLVCVVLDGKGNLDIHEEGKTGFLIDPINSYKFAMALIYCYENPQIYKQIAEYNNVYAKAYDIEAYTSNLIELYQKALFIKQKNSFNQNWP
jgi:glycosyltransferase involved in cell wall biosynthesis